MYPLICTLTWLILGTICAYIAKNRNRNPYIWFFVGLFLGIFGLIILFIIPPKKERALAPILSSSQSSNALPAQFETKMNTLGSSSESPEHSMTKNLWYYLDDENKQYGPMSFFAFKQAWENDQIKSSTFVWSPEMENWKPLEELQEIFSLIRNNPKTDQPNSEN